MSSLLEYPCPRVAENFELDAELGKAAWQGPPAVWLGDTTRQHRPDDADSATLFLRTGETHHGHGRSLSIPQRTAFAACWSPNALYLAFRCEDRDVWGSFGNRDDPLYQEEVVEAFLCPTGDVTRYYELEVSPRNVLFDAAVHSPDRHRGTMVVDTSWDCPGIRTAVRIDGALNSRLGTDRGWSVEIAIPFAAFPEAGTPQPGAIWRANFYRIDRADPPEFSAWSPTAETPANFHVPERFGYLRFVE